ncbi:MAG TPA: DMT family transporter [Gemmatimonadales bacterium]
MNHRQALWALIAITVLWGISIPAVKALYLYASPLMAVAVRFGLAALILAPMLRRVTREELRAGALIGTIFALGVVTQNKGLEITHASRQAFLLSMSALLTPAVAALALKHRPEWSVVARLAVATAGVWLLTGGQADGLAGGLSALNLGDLLTLAAAVFYAGQIVAVGHFAGRVNAGRLLAIQFGMTSVLALLLGPVVETPRVDFAWPLAGLVAFLIFSSLTTFTLQIRAQRVVTSSEAALVYTFEPVVTAFVSWLTLGEVLTAGQWLGGLVILVAVGFPRRGGKREE